MKPNKQPPGNDTSGKDEAAAAEGSSVKPDADGIDARKDQGKLKENRERLGVDDEHKTPDMKDHNRGTFP